MALESTVRWFHSEQSDAPQINAQPGDLIAILEACLVNGFGNKSVTDIEVVDEVATVTISSGHDFERHAVVRIAGADQSELNGDWRVTGEPDGSTFSFDAPGVANVSATGTITCKRATPGYWEKAFADGDKAAFRSTHPDATGFYLRIDDSATGTGSSPVRGYEEMTDIDSGSFPFPTPDQAADLVWRRSVTTSGSLLPRPWTLIADESWIWLMVHFQNANGRSASLWQFGDIKEFSLFSEGGCVLTGHATGSPTNPFSDTSQHRLDGGTTGCWFARPIVFDPEFEPPGYGRVASHRTSSLGDGEDYPSHVSGGYLFHSPVLGVSAGQVRGVVPGLLQGLTESQGTIGVNDSMSLIRVVSESTAAFPRAVLLTSVHQGTTHTEEGYAAFDITGPWR